MDQITKLSISVLKVHPQNQEFFDDIDGEQYEKFKKSIQEDGIITPITVAPDMTIISGHQRCKACKDLSIELVPVIIREDYINEDDKLRKLLAANFGRLKNNPVKQGKVYSEYERLSGVRQGSAGRGSLEVQNAPPTQEQIAKELGVGIDTLKRLKRLQTLSPELQQLIEDGSVKYTTALNVYSKLSPPEQSQLIEELGKDKIAEMTQKQTQKYLVEKKALEQSFNDLSKKYSEEVAKEPMTVEVDNTDYASISKLEQEKKSLLNAKEFQDKKLINLSEQLELYKKDSGEYSELKRQIELLTKDKDDISRKIKSATDLAELVVEVNNLLKNQLAPIKYYRSIIDMKNDLVVMNNLSDILNCVAEWYQDMVSYIPRQGSSVEFKEVN